MSVPPPPQIPRKLPGSGKAGYRKGNNGYVTIQAWREQIAVRALLFNDGIGPATASWERIARAPRSAAYDEPGSAPITWLTGRGNKTKTLDIVLDGFTPETVTRRSRPQRRKGGAVKKRTTTRRKGPVGSQIDRLEEMCDRGLTVRLIGPVRHTARRWAIEELAFNGQPIKDLKTGRIVRARLLVSLVEYAPATGLREVR